MTQQLKFGDRVRWINNPGQFIYLDPDEPTPEAGWIIGDEGIQYLVDHIDLEPIPHPDTVRLDWLIKRNFDFQKCYDMGGRWWYEDNSFDEIEGTEGMTEREAIDKVMEKETEK